MNDDEMNDDQLTGAAELPDDFSAAVPTPTQAADVDVVTLGVLTRVIRHNNSGLAKAAAKAIDRHVSKKVAEATANLESQFAVVLARLESRLATVESERERH